MVQKSIPGWPGMTSLIPCYWRNVIVSTLIVPHPEAMVAPVAARGHQEPPLGEGVVSGIHSHCHLSHRPEQSPDHSHLSTDHPYLQPLIITPTNTFFTQILIVWSTIHCPELTPDTVCTYLCILGFQLSYDPPATLRQRIPCSWFPLSIDPAKILTSVDS